jgi:hypothetical protein
MMVRVVHPSMHTIENIQADAEVIIEFGSPTGKGLVVSSLVRISGNETPSSSFFSKFVPYLPGNNQGGTEIKFSDDWNLSQIVPSNGAFYSYDGSTPGYCFPAKVIVFNSMINMSGTDFAMLTSKSDAAKSLIKPLGNREVYFNSAEHLPGGPMPHDNKIYMRLKPVKGATGPVAGLNPVKAAPLSDGKSKEEAKGGIFERISKWSSDQISTNGIVSILDVIFMLISIGVAFYFTAYKYQQFEGMMLLNKKAFDFGHYVRSFIISRSNRVRPGVVIPTATKVV